MGVLTKAIDARNAERGWGERVNAAKANLMQAALARQQHDEEIKRREAEIKRREAEWLRAEAQARFNYRESILSDARKVIALNDDEKQRMLGEQKADAVLVGFGDYQYPDPVPGAVLADMFEMTSHPAYTSKGVDENEHASILDDLMRQKWGPAWDKVLTERMNEITLQTGNDPTAPEPVEPTTPGKPTQPERPRPQPLQQTAATDAGLPQGEPQPTQPGQAAQPAQPPLSPRQIAARQIFGPSYNPITKEIDAYLDDVLKTPARVGQLMTYQQGQAIVHSIGMTRKIDESLWQRDPNAYAAALVDSLTEEKRQATAWQTFQMRMGLDKAIENARARGMGADEFVGLWHPTVGVALGYTPETLKAYVAAYGEQTLTEEQKDAIAKRNATVAEGKLTQALDIAQAKLTQAALDKKLDRDVRRRGQDIQNTLGQARNLLSAGRLNLSEQQYATGLTMMAAEIDRQLGAKRYVNEKNEETGKVTQKDVGYAISDQATRKALANLSTQTKLEAAQTSGDSYTVGGPPGSAGNVTNVYVTPTGATTSTPPGMQPPPGQPGPAPGKFRTAFSPELQHRIATGIRKRIKDEGEIEPLESFLKNAPRKYKGKDGKGTELRKIWERVRDNG